jgi:hypothetical protein
VNMILTTRPLCCVAFFSKGRHHYMTYLNLLRGLEKPLSKLHLNDYYNAIVEPNLHPGSVAERTPGKVTLKDCKSWD